MIEVRFGLAQIMIPSILSLFLLGALGVIIFAAQPSSAVIYAAPGQPVSDTISLATESDWISIEIIPSQISFGMLNPSDIPFIQEGTLNVYCDTSEDWVVTVTDNDGDTLGYMTKYSNLVYDPTKRLSSGMKINGVDLSISDLSVSGSGPGNKPLIFEQTISWEDTPLPDGCVYRIVPVFIVSIGYSG